jgi:hypothetical protein
MRRPAHVGGLLGLVCARTWHVASRPCRWFNGFRLPPVMLLPQRLRSLRSLGEPANALRRKPHDNPPADAGALSPSIPLRACVPPAGPRGRPAGWPQRPSPLTPRILPSQEPRRQKTGLRPRRPQTPGPAAPVPLRLHSRTPLHSRRPTASACSPVRLLIPLTNQCQRCETPTLDSAPAEPGAHRVPPTRPASTIWAHRSRTRYGPPHTPEGFDARGDNAPRPTKECGSFASSLTAQNGSARHNERHLREPRHPQCQARRGRRRQARDGVPRVTSDVVSSRPRPTTGLIWHSGCAGSACNKTLWPMGARSAPQSKHSIGAAPSLRRASGMWS